MKSKKCNHNSFWQIYKVINFSRISNLDDGIKFKCGNCHEKCTLKWKGYMKIKNNIMKKITTTFLWLSPAMLLIYLVATLRMNYLDAIGIIIVFHFVAMYYIIKRKVKVKSND